MQGYVSKSQVLVVGRTLNEVVFVGRRSFASSSRRQADDTLTVDGKEVTVPQGGLRGVVSYENLAQGRGLV